MDFIATKWQKAFFAVATVQAVICLAFEAYVFGLFQSNLTGLEPDDTQGLASKVRSVPTFLTLFIFAFLYELVLVWDALRMKNTIQVIGLCAANLAIMVYSTIQIDQIGDSILFIDPKGFIKPTVPGEPHLWERCRPFLVAIPIILAFCTILMSYIAFKLYQVFAWDILKQIGADYRMKKRFLHYQIYIALLKFDFFFFLGFCVQFLVIVTGKTNAELGITIAAIPVAIAILILAAVFTRREIKAGMWVIILLYFAALAYFFFKLVRIYQPGFSQNYQAVQKSLTAFSVLTILLIIVTIINAFVCMNNFGAGLKAHILKKDSDLEKNPDVNSIGLSDVKPQLPSRMTID